MAALNSAAIIAAGALARRSHSALVILGVRAGSCATLGCHPSSLEVGGSGVLGVSGIDTGF